MHGFGTKLYGVVAIVGLLSVWIPSANASLRVCNNSGEEMQITGVIREPLDFFFDRWDTYEWRAFEGCVNFFAGENVQVDGFFFFRKAKLFGGWAYLTSSDFRIEEVEHSVFQAKRATLEIGSQRAMCLPDDNGSRENTPWKSLIEGPCPEQWQRRRASFYANVPSNIQHAVIQIVDRHVQMMAR